MSLQLCCVITPDRGKMDPEDLERKVSEAKSQVSLSHFS